MYREKLVDFLDEYFSFTQNAYNGNGKMHDCVIETGLKMLVSEKIFTVKELQKAVVKKCSVLVPSTLFEKE